jgi:hypothetical protein
MLRAQPRTEPPTHEGRHHAHLVRFHLEHAADSRHCHVPRRRPRKGDRGSEIRGRVQPAAGMAAVLELWARGKFRPGFVRQEEIKLSDFLATTWGGKVYG